MRSSSNCHYCHYCYPDYYNQYTYSIFYLQSFLFYYVQLTTHDHTSQLVPLANGLRLLTRSRQSIIIARSVYAIYPCICNILKHNLVEIGKKKEKTINKTKNNNNKSNSNNNKMNNNNKNNN